MTLQISTTQTVSLSIFHPTHISLTFVLHIWCDQQACFFQLCLYHNIRLLLMFLQIFHNSCGFAIFSWEYPTMGFSQQLRTFFLADNIIPNLAIIQQVSIFCHMAHPPFCMRNSYRILAQPLHRYLTKPTQPCPINYFFSYTAVCEGNLKKGRQSRGIQRS